MKIRFLIPCILLVITINAQKDSTKLNLNQVEVIKTFEANLEEASKVHIKAVLPVHKTFDPKYQYDITILPLELKYPAPQIKPLAMNPDEAFRVNMGYIFASYGLRKNPEIMAGYHTSKKDTYEAGFHFNFESLNNESVNIYQKYRNAGLQLYGSWMAKENMKVTGEVNTSFRKRYFFHTDLPVDSLFTEEQSTRTLNAYSVKAGISNAEPTSLNINYNLDLALRNVHLTNSAARESGIQLSGFVEKIFKKSTVLALNGSYEYTAFNGVAETSISTASFQPVLKTKLAKLILHAGATFLVSSDHQKSIFPEVLLSYGVVGQELQVFAGMHLDYYTNNFQNVSMINPYLNTDLDSLVNSINKSFFGGIKGQFSFLNYQIKTGFKNVSRQMYLLNNPQDIRYFDMIFDDTKIFFITANLDFNITDNLSVGGWLTQNIYNPENLTEAWHTPTLTANAYAGIKLLDEKLTFRGDLYLGNSVPFINKNNITDRSNLLFDLNLIAEYAISENLKCFIRGINLFDNKYQRWYGYPAIGINAAAGVKLIF